MLLCANTHACAGYCSLVHFSEGELGTPWAADKIPEHIRPLMKSASKSVAPATPDQAPSAKASRRAATPAEAPAPKQASSASGQTASGHQIQASATASNPSRPGASSQLDLNQPAGAAQGKASQEQGPAQQAGQAERPPLKQVTPEAMPAQPVANGAQVGSAAKEQKRIAPTAIAPTPAPAATPTTGQHAGSYLFLLCIWLCC